MKVILLSLLTLSVTTLFAQNDKNSSTVPNQSFFAELGGPGVLFSANYDTRFKKSKFGLGMRAGLGFVSYYENNYTNTGNGSFSSYSENRSIVTVPLQLNYLLGKEGSVNALEIGAGVTFLGKESDVFNNGRYVNGMYVDDKTRFLGTASFMYRRLPTNGGFSWRLGFTPIIYNGYIQPSGGASVGYNF